MARTTLAPDNRASQPTLRYHQGVLLVLAMGAVFSLGGLAFRSTSTADAWEYLTLRGLGALVATGAVFVVQNRHRMDQVRSRFQPVHLLAGLMMATISALFIIALEFSTVAFVLFLQPVSTIAAAYFSWLILRERVTPLVVAVTGLTIVGVGIMVSGTVLDDVSAGGLLALGIPIVFGLYATTVRAAADIDPSVPALVAGGVLTVLGLVISSATGGLQVSAVDAVIGFGAGALLLGLPAAVFNAAQRVVPSPETSLLLMVEVLLAPVWVWIFIDERPAPSTVVGGVVILAAVVWLTAARLPNRGRTRPDRPLGPPPGGEQTVGPVRPR